MKIVHICLAQFYIDGYAYQENILPRQNKEDGHEVYILASCETFIDNQKLGYVKPSIYINEYGIQVTRIPYIGIFPLCIAKKIRFYKGVREYLNQIRPDVIFSHDLCYFSVLDVLRYKQEHPEVRLYADTHTAKYNSGRNWLSLEILHGLFYKHLIQKALPYLEKYFYIGESEKDFNETVYGVPDSILEYYPLGGALFADEDYQYIREKRRRELGVRSDEILYMHTGKLGKIKCTKELLEAFSSVNDARAKLVIIGVIRENQRDELMPLIQAYDRITFLGWKPGDELREYLCACDVYCQPGGVSATLQDAICQACAILAYPQDEYVEHFDYGNFFWVKNKQDIIRTLKRINEKPDMLKEMKQQSAKCAIELLDYRKLAKKLYR